jgi:hypothetical protein
MSPFSWVRLSLGHQPDLPALLFTLGLSTWFSALVRGNLNCTLWPMSAVNDKTL